MGCDVHIIVERKIPEHSHEWVGVWSDRFGFGNKSARVIGRDYNLFSNLAGVRGSPDTSLGGLYARGLPPDPSRLAIQEIGLWSTDAHSHTYMTIGEFVEIWKASDAKRDKSRDPYIVYDVFGFSLDDNESHNFRLILFFDN